MGTANEMMYGEGAGLGGFGSWGFILFFLFILWAFFNKDKDGQPSNADLALQGIRSSAEIQYNGEVNAREAKEQIMNQAYLIQQAGMQETIFDLKMENTSLKNNIFTKEQTDAIMNKLQECCCQLGNRLNVLECNIPQRPPVYAAGYVADGFPIPPRNGFCG